MDCVTGSEAAPNAVQFTVAAFLVDELLAPR